MPDFRPRPIDWKPRFDQLEPRRYFVVDAKILVKSIQKACNRHSVEGKRFCVHVDAKGERQVWRVE